MPLAKSYAVSLLGLSGTIIEVEADISANLPNFILIGLPDTSLSEATSRVRAACANSARPLPSKKITVNLSPASVPKSGSSFDLAIAISILAAQDPAIRESVSKSVHLGELGLDGSVRPVSGIIPMLLAAREAGFTRAIVPVENLSEAQLTLGISVFGCATLTQLCQFHGGDESVLADSFTVQRESPVKKQLATDLSDVVGQDHAIEALIVAASGGHHFSMIGTPGSGKTMLAERYLGILPELTPEHALEVTAVESLHLGNLGGIQNLDLRPRFQNPHHTASVSSVIGGGSRFPRPGAVSLAHRGVLFLDEALEFQAPVLDSLREPLESGKVLIQRSGGAAKFPANFQLILAANPCSCGHFGSTKRHCECTYVSRKRYLSRLSGPLLDRIDIRLKIEPVSRLAKKMAEGKGGTTLTSSQALQRVLAARSHAANRLTKFGLERNSEIPGQLLRSELKPSRDSLRPLELALDRGQLSMRGFDRCLRLAWTLADLEASSSPSPQNVARAMELRSADSFEDLA
ncbi:MAG: YifB family Mg chelatase-like AAA ATPase [Micrococcales bacterium]